MICSILLAFLPFSLCLQSFSNTTSSTEVPTVTTTITATSITTLNVCPAYTRCHGLYTTLISYLYTIQLTSHLGQTLTITGTSAIAGIACEPAQTCTCVLPPAPPILTVCPADTVCSGQVVTWSGGSGPSSCASTCTIELPGGSSATTTSPGNGSSLSKTPTPTVSSTSGANKAVNSLQSSLFIAVIVIVGVGAAGLI